MDPEKIKSLFAERNHAAAELRSLYDSAGSDELSAEQTQTEERLNSAISTADQRIEALLSLAASEKRAEDAYADLGVEARQAPEAETAAVPTDEDSLRSLLAGGSAEFRAGEHVKGTTTLGGHTVPTSFYDRLTEYMLEQNGVLSAGATVIRTSGGENILVPVATAYPTAAIVGENTGMSNSSATFDQKTLGAFKYAFTMQASSELLDDSAINLTEFFARRGGEALGLGLGADLVNGDGSAAPHGILHSSGALASGVAVTGTTGADKITVDRMIDLTHSVKQPYRNGAKFIVNDAQVAVLRKLREGSGTGAYLWQPSVVAGTPSTFLGYPVVTDRSMPTATTNGTKAVAFGNFGEAVMVRFAGPVRVEVSRDFAFDKDLTTWRFIMRADSEIINTEAAKVFVHTT